MKMPMKIKLMALTLGLSLVAGMAQEAAVARSGTENRPALIPLPVKVERGSGEFVLTGKTTILTDAIEAIPGQRGRRTLGGCSKGLGRSPCGCGCRSRADLLPDPGQVRQQLPVPGGRIPVQRLVGHPPKFMGIVAG